MSEEKQTESKTPGKKTQESTQSRLEPGESKPSVPVKEAQVTKKEEKRAFSKLVEEARLTPARTYVIKHHTGWTDDTLVSRAEFDDAINKHLKGKGN